MVPWGLGSYPDWARLALLWSGLRLIPIGYRLKQSAAVQTAPLTRAGDPAVQTCDQETRSMHNHSAPAASTRSCLFIGNCNFQVVFCHRVGVLPGSFEPSYGEALKPLGDAFIKLVKMIIAPVIFPDHVTGIAGNAGHSEQRRPRGRQGHGVFAGPRWRCGSAVMANIAAPGAA